MLWKKVKFYPKKFEFKVFVQSKNSVTDFQQLPLNIYSIFPFDDDDQVAMLNRLITDLY